MKFNPQTLSWRAPTENVDGTPIDYELNYELGFDLPDGSTQVMVTLPEALNPEGLFEAPINAMDFDNGEWTIRVRALSEEHEGRISAWSNGITFAIGAQPNPPLLEAVA
jgi:hypothetical protein